MDPTHLDLPKPKKKKARKKRGPNQLQNLAQSPKLWATKFTLLLTLLPALQLAHEFYKN
jgi:hypothetical protein